MQVTIAYQGTGQQSRFAQNLKAIANPENESAILRKLLHGSHHRRESRERARTQIIAIRKATGDDDCIVTTQIGIAMPNEIDRLTDVFRNNVIRVVVAVRAGKN